MTDDPQLGTLLAAWRDGWAWDDSPVVSVALVRIGYARRMRIRGHHVLVPTAAGGRRAESVIAGFIERSAPTQARRLAKRWGLSKPVTRRLVKKVKP